MNPVVISGIELGPSGVRERGLRLFSGRERDPGVGAARGTAVHSVRGPPSGDFWLVEGFPAADKAELFTRMLWNRGTRQRP